MYDVSVSAKEMLRVLQQYDTTEVHLMCGPYGVRLTKIADLEVLLEDVDQVTFAEDERLPYWAELWPSSVALAQYVARDDAIAGRQVLELGCGLGLVGVVAAMHGAHVLCTDYEADAIAFARYNARRNACREMHFSLVDWRQPALPQQYDMILASDVIYEARNFDPLVELLQHYLARGGRALFAEPGRTNAMPFFPLLRQCGFVYRTETVPVEWDGSHQIHISTIQHDTNHTIE